MRRTRTKYDLRELRQVWEVLCSVYASKGIDVQQFIRDAVTETRKWLSKWGGESAFKKLREAGCTEESLAILLHIIRSGPRWSNTWRMTVGSTRHRKQLIAILDKAASALQRLDKLLDRAVSNDEIARSGHSPSRLETHSDSQQHTLPLSLPATARSLLAYARALDLLGSATTEAKIHSPEAFGKYLLSAYVQNVTDEFHDADVSALIASALGEMYTETAHRMWRSRNYKHFDSFSFPIELLIGLGVLLASGA